MRRGGGSRRERGREGSGGGRRERQASRDGTLGLSGPGAGLRGSADPHAAPAGTSSCFLGSSWVRLGRWGCQYTTSQPGTSWQSRALGPQPTWATGHFCAEGVYGPASRRSHARPCPGQCQLLLPPCTQSPLLSVCSMETQRAPPPPRRLLPLHRVGPAFFRDRAVPQPCRASVNWMPRPSCIQSHRDHGDRLAVSPGLLVARSVPALGADRVPAT